MDGSRSGDVNTSHMPRPDTTSNDFGINNNFLGTIQNYPDQNDQPRPTPSPAPLDHFQYQNSPFKQTYLQPHQRQSTPSQQFHPPRPQTYSPFGGWDSRTQPAFGGYQGFQDQNQQPGHRFVDPSIFNGTQVQNINGNYQPIVPQQQYQSSPYYTKAGSGVTIDPRALQDQQQFLYNQQHLQRPQHLGQQLPQLQPRAPADSHVGSLVPVQAENQTKKKAPADPNAVKRSRGRPRKDGQPGSQSGDQGSGSDSDLSIVNDPEVRPTMLTVSMPTEFRSQCLYKVVDAVWCDRNNPAPVDKIKSGINDFGTVVKAFRDSWKDKNEKLKKAEIEGSPTTSDAPKLKKDVSDDRTYMGRLMDQTLNFGHPAVLKSLGENHWTMSALYSFMLDRVSAGDLDSPLVTSILKLAVNFNTLDDAKLETIKWTKILQRLTKKSTGEARDLARRIIASAAALTAKKQAEGARSSPGINGDAQSGVKRSRDAEGSQLPPRKTVVKPSSKPLALQNAERRRVLEKEETAKKARESKEAAGHANGTHASAVSKPKVTLPPKSNAIASLMSASKKPGTSNAERAAAAKDKTSGAPPIKKDASKRDSPPRSTSAPPRVQPSFMGILSDINKKKDVKTTTPDEFANETPEQKAKRLRKEARRKLRVSWKSDSDLVETRLFTHDPDEEVGLEDSMMRDAGDTMSEGEMLKRKMAMTDLDEDEEDDEISEDSYSPPSEIDFNAIFERDPTADITSNGIKFGGPIKADSPSRAAQDQFEVSTLMVVFDGKSDRPITPKEPPEDGDDENFQPCVDFGDPDDKVRQRERDILQKRQALTPSFDLSVLAKMTQIQAAIALPAPAVAPPQTRALTDLQSILSKLQAGQQAQPATATPAFSSNLAALVDSVHKAQQRPQPYSLPAQPATTAQIDIAAILAAATQQAKSSKHGLDDSEDGEKKKPKYPPNYKTQSPFYSPPSHLHCGVFFIFKDMATSPNALIIVCCHAIYLGSPHDPHVESSWLIEPFQTGEVPTFISHIKAGLDALKKHGESAILCFSGGSTKPGLTKRSEAEGYAEAAMELGLLETSGRHDQERSQHQIFCDQWATDSFQNVMCSLMQWPHWFHQSHMAAEAELASARGVKWPRKLVIVSHAFKRRRFLELHLPALRWNGQVEYIGIDPPFDQKRMAEIVEGDRLRGYGVWKDDLYGQRKGLNGKREKRGWVEEGFLSALGDMEIERGVRTNLAELVKWDGGGNGVGLFPHALPWEQPPQSSSS
ncbi:hypothetical protein DV736_g832, partial [Chaetothyriales sp. CBS 134916]